MRTFECDSGSDLCGGTSSGDGRVGIHPRMDHDGIAESTRGCPHVSWPSSEEESGKERRWRGKGRRGKKKIGGIDRVIVCTDRESWGVDFNGRPVRQVVLLIFWPNMFEGLDGSNTPVGMVSPPSLATNDNSPL